MKPQGYVPPSASPSAHEVADLHVPSILRVAVVLVVVLVTSILSLLLFFRHLEHTHGPRTSEAAPRVTDADLPPAPRLQVSPLHDLQVVRSLEDSHLNHYGWIDHPHGIAQIPVERAMILWVESYAATPSQTATTNVTPVAGMTELQMRQQKAQEGSHAP